MMKLIMPWCTTAVQVHHHIFTDVGHNLLVFQAVLKSNCTEAINIHTRGGQHGAPQVGAGTEPARDEGGCQGH